MEVHLCEISFWLAQQLNSNWKIRPSLTIARTHSYKLTITYSITQKCIHTREHSQPARQTHIYVCIHRNGYNNQWFAESESGDIKLFSAVYYSCVLTLYSLAGQDESNNTTKVICEVKTELRKRTDWETNISLKRNRASKCTIVPTAQLIWQREMWDNVRESETENVWRRNVYGSASLCISCELKILWKKEDDVGIGDISAWIFGFDRNIERFWHLYIHIFTHTFENLVIPTLINACTTNTLTHTIIFFLKIEVMVEVKKTRSKT